MFASHSRTYPIDESLTTHVQNLCLSLSLSISLSRSLSLSHSLSFLLFTAGFDDTGCHPGKFPGFNPNLPNLDTFEEEMLADWSEDQKKEREVILGNRYIPYSGKLSREKTFTNFGVLESPIKVFLHKMVTSY